MNCLECICIPFIYIFRCIVAYLPCCFKHGKIKQEPFDIQLQCARSKKGGWFDNYHQNFINTRDTFYTLLGLRMRNRGLKETIQFVQKLSDHMNASGQIPYTFQNGWYELTPLYKKNNIPIIDANIFFIIMAWWAIEMDHHAVKNMFLQAQRAYAWLETYICQHKIYEPVGSSWTYTYKHTGYNVLTNVLMTQAIRSMELISCVLNEKRHQDIFVKKHNKYIANLTPNLYQTPDTLSRMLALYWNILPSNFIESFDQQLCNMAYIPIRTEGPIPCPVSFESKIYGYNDLHLTIVWPFLGFLWVSILCKKSKKHLAEKWWESYIEFHHRSTLYNIYSKETGLPIRRAFLKAKPCHAMTLSLHMAAHQALKGVPV